MINLKLKRRCTTNTFASPTNKARSESAPAASTPISSAQSQYASGSPPARIINRSAAAERVTNLADVCKARVSRGNVEAMSAPILGATGVTGAHGEHAPTEAAGAETPPPVIARDIRLAIGNDGKRRWNQAMPDAIRQDMEPSANHTSGNHQNWRAVEPVFPRRTWRGVYDQEATTATECGRRSTSFSNYSTAGTAEVRLG